MDVAKTPAGKQRIQSADLAGQDMIAQGAQDHRQVAEQLFGGGVLLALAVAANHCHQGVGGGHLRVEVIDGRTQWIGVEFVSYGNLPMRRRYFVFAAARMNRLR